MLASAGWPRDYQEQFWEAYPRRVAKKAAMKALNKVFKSKEVPFEVLLSAVKLYARSVVGKEMQYVAHPASWINAGRWDDEMDALLNMKVGTPNFARESVKVHVKQDTPQWEAWRKFRGKPLPVDKHGGWWVSSEWPR